jgi:hypothetical protein
MGDEVNTTHPLTPLSNERVNEVISGNQVTLMPIQKKDKFHMYKTVEEKTKTSPGRNLRVVSMNA